MSFSHTNNDLHFYGLEGCKILIFDIIIYVDYVAFVTLD